jgi:hypothetical protein
MEIYTVLDELRDRLALLPGIAVVNEPHTATKGTVVRLAHWHPTAVTVTDGAAVTYAEGLDYAVRPEGLAILDTFTGEDGSAIAASYTWNTVQTCRIGLESTLTPADYPMIRLVPARVRKSEVMFRRIVEVLIYFGLPLYEELEGGLEGIYQDLLAMEQAIVDALKPGKLYRVGYLETITDEDRLEHYKLMAVRCEVEG